jgi:uncharacterized protein YbjT (DUF2867 family)
LKYLLESKQWDVVALTRNANSDKAKALVAQGARVVQGDAEVPATLDEAFKGAYGVFAVTNFWEGVFTGQNKDPFTAEVRTGHNIADACKRQGVKHVVWSTLDQCNVPHFQSKFTIGEHFTQIGVPTTHLYTAFYYENAQMFGLLKKQDDGSYAFGLPMDGDKEIPAYSVSDTGVWVAWAFAHPKLSVGQNLKVVSEYITPNQLVEQASKVTGKKVVFNRLPNGALGHELQLNMDFFVANQEPADIRDKAWTYLVHPKTKKWVDVVAGLL